MQPDDLYRHYKGTVYKILTLATEVESQQPVVVYQDTTAPEKIWVRAVAIFEETIDLDGTPTKRFTKVDN